MIIDTIRDVILSNIGVLKQAPKNWQKRNCMLCHTQGHGKDTRSRFGIQFTPNSVAVHCFNCGFAAGYEEGKDLSNSFQFFLKQIGISDDAVKRIKFEVFKEINKIQVTREGDNDNELKIKDSVSLWKPSNLPDESMPLSHWINTDCRNPKFLSVLEYAVNRKLLDFDSFYWTPIRDFQLSSRLIIPYTYREKIVGFTARLHYDTPDKRIPKYYQQCPPDFLYNIDNQQAWSRKYIILTEGVLDAYFVDGVGILGEASKEKINILNRFQKEIIVCPDRDRKGRDLVDVAIDNGWAVSFPLWERHIKDAAAATQKYGALLTTHSIISTAIKGRSKIDVRWRLEQNERNKGNNRR